METLAAGGYSGVVETVAVQPMEFLKTRFQLSTTTRTPSMWQAARAVVKEGGVRRFYRGLLPEATSTVPKTAVQWAGYEQSRLLLEAQYLRSRGSAPGAGTADGAAIECLSGLATAVPGALVATPFQVIKTRLQAKEHLGRYANTMDALTKVLAAEGPRALSTGLGVTVARNAVWNGVYFPTTYLVRHALGAETASGSTAAGVTLVSGFIGGTLATCFNCPFDVLKSRIQSELPNATQPSQYTGVVQGLHKIATEEGVQGLYKGFAPKVLRMALGGGIGMAVFDAALSMR